MHMRTRIANVLIRDLVLFSPPNTDSCGCVLAVAMTCLSAGRAGGAALSLFDREELPGKRAVRDPGVRVASPPCD